MNIQNVQNYLIKNIKANPILTLVTIVNCLVFLFNFFSTARVDYYVVTNQIKANADQINQLQSIVSTDHSSILILQQIAKDNVSSQQNLSIELNQFHTDFEQYLLNKVK